MQNSIWGTPENTGSRQPTQPAAAAASMRPASPAPLVPPVLLAPPAPPEPPLPPPLPPPAPPALLPLPPRAGGAGTACAAAACAAAATAGAAAAAAAPRRTAGAAAATAAAPRRTAAPPRPPVAAPVCAAHPAVGIGVGHAGKQGHSQQDGGQRTGHGHVLLLDSPERPARRGPREVTCSPFGTPRIGCPLGTSRLSRLPEVDQTALDRHQGGGGAVADSQLGVDALQVRLDGAGADRQGGADLAVAQAARHQLQHRHLAR